ncbi:MAG: hypothetical protein HY327_08245 [Chloroflexi bacterium]|nr:hypothetical protein [Chloroflexota bacterium]
MRQTIVLAMFALVLGIACTATPTEPTTQPTAVSSSAPTATPEVRSLPPQGKPGASPAPAQGKQLTPPAITPPQSKQGTLPAPKSSPASSDTAPATTITTVTNPASGAKLFVAVYAPKDPSKKYPAVVLVPGGNGDSSGFTRLSPRGDSTVGEFVNGGFVAIAFDPDGRGKSGGKEDYDGYTHQDSLRAVIQYAASLANVDAKQIGIATFSYGITMGSGVLARYSELPVKYLIDWEGPSNRDETGGCGTRGVSGHLANVATCADEKFWQEREARTFIAKVRVPYQRVQSEKDHVQPDNAHAVYMINAAIMGGVPWVRLNDYAPNQTYDPKNPPKMLPETDDAKRDAAIVKYAQELTKK